MEHQIEQAMRQFRTRRMNIKALAYGLAIMIFISGVTVVNGLITNAWLAVGGYLLMLILALSAYTVYYDFRLRKILSLFDFILDEYLDPKAYLEILRAIAKTKQQTPAILTAMLRGMMVGESDKELQAFLNKYHDELGETPNVLAARFRIKDYSEKMRDLAEYETAVLGQLNKTIEKTRREQVKANIMHQKQWFEVQMDLMRQRYEAVLTQLDHLETYTKLEALRAKSYQAQALMHSGAKEEALKLYQEIADIGKETRYAYQARRELEGNS